MLVLAEEKLVFECGVAETVELGRPARRAYLPVTSSPALRLRENQRLLVG